MPYKNTLYFLSTITIPNYRYYSLVLVVSVSYYSIQLSAILYLYTSVIDILLI